VGATRNFGINQTSGDYVMLLDPDNRMHPSFIERAVHAMEQDSSIAYVTSWLHCIDESGAPNRAPSLGPPIGNFPGLVNSHNCAGDAMALVRRSVFDAGHRYDALIDGFEDWEFYRELHRARLYGHVVPEPLLDYRIRQDSKLRSISEIDSVRLNAEMRANQRSAGMQWNKI
jgi:GT2 family glycosyltransferase